MFIKRLTSRLIICNKLYMCHKKNAGKDSEYCGSKKRESVSTSRELGTCINRSVKYVHTILVWQSSEDLCQKKDSMYLSLLVQLR